MIDWYALIDDWIASLLRADGAGSGAPSDGVAAAGQEAWTPPAGGGGDRTVNGEAPGFQIIGKAVVPSRGGGSAGGGGPHVVSMIPPVRIIPADRHIVTFHKDWGLSKRHGTWKQVRALWRLMANRGTASPYARPIIYKEPASGAGWIDGQKIRYRDFLKGGDPITLRVQDRPAVGYPVWVQTLGHEIRHARISWRGNDWLHWKSRIYMSTSRFLDSLPRFPDNGEIRVQANLHFGVHKRCIQNAAGKRLEEAAAKLGQWFPVSAWAVDVFDDFDPVWWSVSELKKTSQFKALKKS